MTPNSTDYKRLIRPIEDQMVRSVARIVRDPADAEDAFQEALAKIWKNLRKVRQHRNPHALILRICANAAYDALRRRARRGRLEHAAANPHELADRTSGPLERLAGQDRRAEILQAIARLPRRQAEAILMSVVQDQSYGDIAEVMGCGEATVRKHVSRGRAKLCELLAHLAPHKTREVTT